MKNKPESSKKIKTELNSQVDISHKLLTLLDPKVNAQSKLFKQDLSFVEWELGCACPFEFLPCGKVVILSLLADISLVGTVGWWIDGNSFIHELYGLPIYPQCNSMWLEPIPTQ